MISYIYALIDPNTEEIRYIGKTVNTKRRYQSHFYKNSLKGKNHKNHWIKSLLNKGQKPKMKILAKCKSENINSKEKYYITKYKNLGFSLTNTTDGGDGWPQGVPAVGNAKKGNKKPQFKKAVKAVNKYNHKKVLYFNSIKEAAKLMNTHKINISECLSGKIKSINGYHWFYHNDEIIIPKYKEIKTVLGECSKTGKLYMYPSTWQVSNRFDRSTICKACKGKAYGLDGHYYKNIRWEYI